MRQAPPNDRRSFTLTDGTLLTKPEYDLRDRDDPPPNLPEQTCSDGMTADYYELPKGVSELEELILQRNMNHQIGTIFSSCYRYGLVDHSSQLREAKKIMFYSLAEVCRLINQERTIQALVSFADLFKAVRNLISTATRLNNDKR